MRKNHIKPYVIVLLALLCYNIGHATTIDSIFSKIEFKVIAGSKVGGAAPLSMPVEIRKIRSYSPANPYFIGAGAQYPITPKWGVSLGVVFEGKGMNTDATVKGYKTTFNANEDPTANITGYYTGDITTNVQNLYISIPIQATYQLSHRWRMELGPYLSFAVKRKFFGSAYNGYMREGTPVGDQVDIDNADYDFKESVRPVDIGFSAGTRYGISKRIFALGQFDYGFNNIMKTGFESISFGLHNIFLNVGVGVKF